MKTRGLCVIIAKDRETRRTLLERLAKEKLASDQDKEIGLLRIDGLGVDAYDALIRALSSPPMFARFQIVAFEGMPLLGGKPSGVQAWKNALSVLPSRTMVVFMLEEPVPSHPLFSFLMQSSSVIEGDRLQKALWGEKLKAVLQDFGGSVSPEAKRFLWENYRYDTQQASFELEKMLLSGSEQPIAPACHAGFDAFEAMRLFERGDLAAGFRETKSLYRGAASPFSVVGAIAWKIRQHASRSGPNDRSLLKLARELESRLKTTRLPKALMVEMFFLGLIKGRS